MRRSFPLTIGSSDVEVGNVNDPHQEKPRGKTEAFEMWRLSLKERQEEQVGLNPLLVEKRLDQLRASRDIRFGRSQEGAWRQAFQVNTHYSLIKGGRGQWALPR